MTSPNDSVYIRRFFSVYSQEEKDKVRGHAFYPSDYLKALLPEAVAHVFVLRSPHAEAEFSFLDQSEAEQMPGVIKIITAKDVPRNLSFGGGKKSSQLILAENKVRFKGEPLGLVVAESFEQAKAAAQWIRIDWKPQPIYEAKEVERFEFKSGEAISNVLEQVTTSFRFPSLHARYLETESGWVSLENDELIFHIGSLLSESQRLWLSEVLNLPVSSLKAQETYLGGQFGGRQQRELIVFLGLASFLSKRSCCLALEYENQDVGSYGFSGELSIFYNPETKKMIGLEGEVLIDSGSYEGSASAILKRALEHAACLYRFESVHLRAAVIQTPSHPRRQLRGEGITALTWVTEQLVNEIARSLDVSPLEFRSAHAQSEDRRIFEEIEKLEKPFRLIKGDRNRPVWDAKEIEGRGFAFQKYRTSSSESLSIIEVAIELQPSGSFVIRTSNMTLDLHMKTALCEVAALVLKTHPKAFTVEGQMRLAFDEARKRDTYPEFYYMAHAVWHAADQLRTKMKLVGAQALSCREVVLKDGAIIDPEGSRKMGYRELGFTQSKHDLQSSYILKEIEHPHGCTAGAVSRVSFHPLTGELRVQSVKVVLDAGPVFYRLGLELEAEAAVAWAMAALFSSQIERDQPIPTPMDGPEAISLFTIDYPMESIDERAPRFFGARGISGTLMSVVLASLVGAIQDAREEFLDRIPMSANFMYPELRSNLVHMLPFKR
jgi:CO/xanthine dehydrogenase Mo-binding subunit